MREEEIGARISGSLFGLGVGDALGGPIETMTAAEIAQLFPQGVTDYPDISRSELAPGEVTDDTQMALFVSKSLIECGGLDMADVSRRLVQWGSLHRDHLGPSTSQGIAALKRGDSWREAGSVTSPSSGVLPRTAPLALVLPETEIVDATIDCCAPTHRHPVAIASAVAQNIILCALVNGLDWSSAIRKLETESFCLTEAQTVCDAIASGRGESGALAVFAEAFDCVAPSQDARTALTRAVSMGGDTDTRGAVAGALAGARWGHDALPKRWVERCVAREALGAASRGLMALHAQLSGRM